MPTALALSPHLDDAAFSCGGTLATLAARGWRVVIATLFTQSVPDPKGFALACQLDKGLPADVDYMRLRRAEDAAAATLLGIEPPLWLPHPEAPHRGYSSAKALFAAVRPEDRIDDALTRTIDALFRTRRPDLVLAPQAIGGHVDHIQVMRALQRVVSPAPVLLWRDFPYTVRSVDPPEPFREAMNRWPEAAMVLGAEAVDRKRRACRAYGTQIGFQFGGLAELDARIDAEGGVERMRVMARGTDVAGLIGAGFTLEAPAAMA